MIKVKYSKLGRKLAWGLAHISKRLIEIDERAKGKKHLEILNHEALHILFPKLTEDEIIKASIELTNLLWKENYRKTDNSNKIKLQNGKYA